MVRRYEVSISTCMVDFLRSRGRAGASPQEIYEAVQKRLREEVPVSSVYSVLYARIKGANSDYRPVFERFQVGKQNRYRLLKRAEA